VAGAPAETLAPDLALGQGDVFHPGKVLDLVLDLLVDAAHSLADFVDAQLFFEPVADSAEKFVVFAGAEAKVFRSASARRVTQNLAAQLAQADVQEVRGASFAGL